VASDEEIRRMIDEIERLKRQIRNLKSKVKRRRRKLERTFTPLERQRIEFEIELLKGEIRRYEIVEMQLSLPLIKAIGNSSERKLEDKVDWSKAGKA
jgi:archaellum component FlaC